MAEKTTTQTATSRIPETNGFAYPHMTPATLLKTGLLLYDTLEHDGKSITGMMIPANMTGTPMRGTLWLCTDHADKNFMDEFLMDLPKVAPGADIPYMIDITTYDSHADKLRHVDGWYGLDAIAAAVRDFSESCVKVYWMDWA